MPKESLKLLVVDDDVNIGQIVLNVFAEHQVDIALNGSEALQILNTQPGFYDVVLLDQILGDGPQGIDILRFIKSTSPDIPVIWLTGNGKQEDAIEALRAGAYRYFAKPFNISELATTVQFAAEQDVTQQAHALLSLLTDVLATVTSAPDLIQLLQRICQAAVEVFNVQHSGIVWFDPSYAVGNAIAEYPDRATLGIGRIFGTTIPVKGVPAEERLVYSREILHFPEVADASELGQVRDILITFGIQSILIVPIVVDDRVVASISLDVLRGKRSFSRNEIRFCESLAHLAANSIINQLRRGELEGLFISSPLGIVTTNQSGAITAANPQALRILGYTDAEVRQLTVFDLYAAPEYAREVGDALKRSPDGKIYRYETTILTKSGEHQVSENRIPILLSASLLYDAEGNHIGSLGYFEPTVEVSETQRALAKAQTAARVIAKVATLGDVDVTLNSVTKATIETMGCDVVMLYTFDRVTQRLRNLPKYAGKLFYPERAIEPDEPISPGSIIYTLYREGQMKVVEDIHTTDGFNTARFPRDEKIQSCLVVPLTVNGNKVGLMFVNYRNSHKFEVEERENIQLFADLAAVAIANAELYEQLREQESKRNKFVEDVTHQLVGTLSGFRAHCENLVLGKYDAIKGRKVLQALVEQGGMLQRYAENAVWAARGDRDIFHPSECKLVRISKRKLVHDILIANARSFQGTAREKGLSGLTIDENSLRDFPDINIDIGMFEIVIINLFDNAVKYSHESSPIDVIGQVLGNKVEIRVISHGIVLRPEDTARIFERYERTEEAEEKVQVGTGIGLFLCSEIMKLHQGEIYALPSKPSLYGNEVEFVLTLPAAT